MSQQIINIPVNWDDDAFSRVLEKGVIEEIKKDLYKKMLDELGLNRYYGHSSLFEDIVRECMRELIEEYKDEIIKEVTSKCYRSITSSKDFREAKKALNGVK